MLKGKTLKLNTNTPLRVPLKAGLVFNITATISDAAIFNHYVLKEYAPRVQGSLAFSKNPAKHTLENCLYDEISGWLDAPTVTGISIVNIDLVLPTVEELTLNEEPKISFSEIVDFLYNMYKVLNSGAVEAGSRKSFKEAQVVELKDKIKWILKNTSLVDFNEPPAKEISKVGT